VLPLQVILTRGRKSKSLEFNSYNLENGENHLALNYDLYSYDGNEAYSKHETNDAVVSTNPLFSFLLILYLQSLAKHLQHLTNFLAYRIRGYSAKL
jgi:hypothetical protein